VYYIVYISIDIHTSAVHWSSLLMYIF